jgi:hypothetical protein
MADRVKVAKHLPKRTRNDNLKARRHRSWLRCQERKQARRKANEAAHRANLAKGYREWDRAKAARTERWREAGTPLVPRTNGGNIIRPGGRVDACCHARQPCVHAITAWHQRHEEDE